MIIDSEDKSGLEYSVVRAGRSTSAAPTYFNAVDASIPEEFV